MNASARFPLPRVPVFLVLFHAALVSHSALIHGPVIDEPAHIVAGVSHWHFARFELYNVNPPLVRMIAALPVLAAGARTNWGSYFNGPQGRSEFDVAEDFLRDNGKRAFALIALARQAAIPLSVLGAWICYLWGRDLYGGYAGIAALSMWCFGPNILAYAAVITPDLGATAVGVAANYLFWKWLREPTWSRAIVAGTVLGLAELTKTTWLVLFVVWPLATCGMLATRLPYAGTRRRVLISGAQLGAILLLAVYVINVGYGFERTGMRLRDYVFKSSALSGARSDLPRQFHFGNRFANGFLGYVFVPLPYNYVRGIDAQRAEFDWGKPSYLRAVWRERGWWYYYFYALSVKAPLGAWALVVLGVAHRVVSRRARARWRDEIFLLAPLAAVLAIVSVHDGFSRYLRYALPIAPYAFVWVGGLFGTGRGNRIAAARRPLRPSMARLARPRHMPFQMVLKSLGVAALCWSLTSSLYYFPHSMSYFNELAGGPVGGHAHLIDANIDWGQDLLLLKGWLDQHPESRTLGLAYFGPIDPKLAGIEYTLPPKGPAIGTGLNARARRPANLRAGWYAISVNYLRGYSGVLRDGQGGKTYLEPGCLSYFLTMEPVARIGYSIYIYHVEST